MRHVALLAFLSLACSASAPNGFAHDGGADGGAGGDARRPIDETFAPACRAGVMRACTGSESAAERLAVVSGDYNCLENFDIPESERASLVTCMCALAMETPPEMVSTQGRALVIRGCCPSTNPRLDRWCVTDAGVSLDAR